MVSINTNLSSIIAQRSMTTSTNKLNQAIERMSTGYKINHAGDNAVNYSISKNMNVQLSSLDIASDNISMGMDLLQTAQDTIAELQDRGSRLQALITQARNGTYGASSLAAISTEAQALVAEINRLYINTEYNGMQLFDNVELPDWAKEIKNSAGKVEGQTLGELALSHSGFIADVIEEIPDITISNPDELENAISSNTKIGIGNAETLAKLAEIVNHGTATCEGKTIILTNDISLSAYQESEGWIPIGNMTNYFRGIFNGNGHNVTGLYINRPDAECQGLLGCTSNEIKNVGIEGGIVVGNELTGGLVGYAKKTIINCYSTCDVSGKARCTGGLSGCTSVLITDSYATGTVTGIYDTGGLTGIAQKITNCFATGNVTGSTYVGGLAGECHLILETSYASGNVAGEDNVGGLIGYSLGFDSIKSCYSTGSVIGQTNTGGLIGFCSGANIIDCYSISNVSGTDNIGGFSGTIELGVITDCYVTGDTAGTGVNISDFIGNNEYEDAICENCETFKYKTATFQVGINGNEDSQISVNTNLRLDLSIGNLTSDSSYNNITDFLNYLSQKATELGAAQNRLESALESNMVQTDNLTKSLSTIRDADISKVTSEYIRQQILQQAAATVMSTANQSPAIALQLI